MTRLAIAINKTRCIGCQTCAFACKMQNNVPEGMRWNRVITEGCDVEDGALGTYPNLSRSYLPIACQHCENPACQRVCPTGATYKDDKGRVEIDYDKCIGCRMCEKTCKFDAIHVVDGVAKIDYDKCKNCKMCTKACPKGCIEPVPTEEEKAKFKEMQAKQAAAAKAKAEAAKQAAEAKAAEDK